MTLSKPFTVQIVEWSQQHDALAKIRTDVFVEEQSVPVEIILDGLDAEGVHADHIEMWREKMRKALEPESADKKSERGEMVYRILDLEKELLRKDKALAEAAAILILKKKVDLIWGIEEPK